MSKVYEFSQDHPKTNPGFDPTQLSKGDNMKKTAKEIAAEFKAEGATTTSEFVAGADTTEINDLPEPRVFVEYSTDRVDGSNVLDRITFDKIDGEPIKDGICINPGAHFGTPRILQDRVMGDDGKSHQVLDIPKGLMNLIAGLLAKPGEPGYYFCVVPGASWHINPEDVSFATYLDNAVYADGRYLEANGFGKFSHSSMFVGHIAHGGYSFREIRVVQPDSARIAELSKTEAGLKQVELEQMDRNMAAKFLAGQFLVSGKCHYAFPKFWKGPKGSRMVDLDHVKRYVEGFKASFAGDTAAITKGKALYRGKVAGNEMRTERQEVVIGARVVDQNIMVSVKQGDTVVSVKAATLIGGWYDMKCDAFTLRVPAEDNLVFAQTANQYKGVLIPVPVKAA